MSIDEKKTVQIPSPWVAGVRVGWLIGLVCHRDAHYLTLYGARFSSTSVLHPPKLCPHLSLLRELLFT